MLDTPKRVVRAAMADNITGEAAKATYYLFFSIFPLIIAAFALTGLLGGERAFVWIMERLEALVPGQGSEILEGFVADITRQQRFDALSIGLLLAIWAGSNFFAALGEGLDRMFNVQEDAGFLKRRGKALLMLVAGGLLIAAGATAILLGPLLAEAAGLGYVGSLLRWPLGFLLIVGVLFLMYLILPNRDQSDIRREIAIGAFVGAAVWLLATGGFSFYVGNFADYDQTYGAFGAIIVFMLWLFITALSVLFGGEVAHVLSEGEGASRHGEAGGRPGSDAPRQQQHGTVTELRRGAAETAAARSGPTTVVRARLLAADADGTGGRRRAAGTASGQDGRSKRRNSARAGAREPRSGDDGHDE
jgi:membrane protein